MLRPRISRGRMAALRVLVSQSAARPAFRQIEYEQLARTLAEATSLGRPTVVSLGGGTTAGNGAYCIPNMPTEEVFTTPHKNRADGTVTATKPLSHQGTMIEGIQVRFEGGRIVEARATKGQEVLQKLIDTDEGARRLGEVALVPHSSPIAASGLLFFNTLFDENAACHIALGQAYSSCLIDGDKLTPEQLAAKGANDSLIHVDWMIGSDKLDIDGITFSGAAEPLMRQGEWV